MRTAKTRSLAAFAVLAGVASFAAVLSTSACSYDEDKAAITVNVSGIPSTADELVVVLNDSTSATFTRSPAFGPGVYTDLAVVFPAPATGVVTVSVTAQVQVDGTPLATSASAITGNYSGTPISLSAPLTATGAAGSFGTACGAGDTCLTGLSCHKYGGTDTGVCTKDCPNLAGCDPVPAGATCVPFNAPTGQGVCQWECDLSDGGVSISACPAGLVCGAALVGDGNKRFCQGHL
jgi:hypothetical protein